MKAVITLLVTLSCFALISGQQAGTVTAEVHPRLTTYGCRSSGCSAQDGTSVTLDASWRWLHHVGGYDNCYGGTGWNKTYCPDPVSCAKNCAYEGADYKNTYGVTTNGDAITLQFVTPSGGIGSRLYLMQDDNNYQLFKLKNREIAYEVDVSTLVCGINGALYLVEMPGDGGKGKFPGNQAGAKFGTGYCDAQCPKDMKFINGEANLQNTYGACCIEMDLWEANSMAAALTPHPCDTVGLFRCNGSTCVNRCDQGGCDFNSYRQGDTKFYGPGGAVDTRSKFTVVTQFITSDNTDNGRLVEIRRIYAQNGKVIQNSKTTWPGISPYNSISDKYCVDQKNLFKDSDQFTPHGGLENIGKSLERGMVLVFSVWDDHASHMLWLDSKQPVDGDERTPGVARGACATNSGDPNEIEKQNPKAYVTWSGVRWGPIDSTLKF